jgi:hypothetical protein
VTAGNMRVSPLSAIMAGAEMAEFRSEIPRRAADPCGPGAECAPDAYPCYPKVWVT